MVGRLRIPSHGPNPRSQRTVIAFSRIPLLHVEFRRPQNPWMPRYRMTRTLILIDCQSGFNDGHWGQRNNPDFEANANLLLTHWRSRSWPVVHVRHASQEVDSPLRADLPGFAFMDWAEPILGEDEHIKTVNSGFIGTELENDLRTNGVVDLVFAGLTTNHCVSTTVRMAGNLGFNVHLVGDACAAFERRGVGGEVFTADVVHRTALANLHEEFCTVVSTAAVVGLP